MLSDKFNIMQQILNQMNNHWIWLKKYPGGEYVFVNDAFCVGSGLQRDEIIGKNDFDLWYKDAQHFISKDIAVAENKLPIIVKEHTPGTYTERRLLETMKFPIFDADHNVIGVAGIARDVQWEEDLQHYMQQSVVELEQIVKEGR